MCPWDRVQVARGEAVNFTDLTNPPTSSPGLWSLGSDGWGPRGRGAEGCRAPPPSPCGVGVRPDKCSRRCSHGCICPGIYCVFKRHILTQYFQLPGRLGWFEWILLVQRETLVPKREAACQDPAQDTPPASPLPSRCPRPLTRAEAPFGGSWPVWQWLPCGRGLVNNHTQEHGSDYFPE